MLPGNRARTRRVCGNNNVSQGRTVVRNLKFCLSSLMNSCRVLGKELTLVALNFRNGSCHGNTRVLTLKCSG